MNDADPSQPEFDRRKIRIGLVMIAVVVIVSIALVFVVPSPVLRVFFGGLVVVAALQMWRLARIIRGEQGG